MRLTAADRIRIGRARYARTQAAMAARGVDVLLLSRYASAHYVSGARRVQLAGGGGGAPWVVVFARDQAPLVYTPDLDGVPRWIGAGRPMQWNPAELVAEIRSRAPRRLAYDLLTPHWLDMLREALPAAEWIDAEELLADVRAPHAAESIEGRLVVEEPSPFPPLRMQDGSTPIPELAQQRRMNVERAMADAGIDGMVLFKPANLRYATGGRAAGGIVKAGAPPLPLAEPTEANANAMTECAARVAEALSGARRVAIDRWSAPLFAALRRLLPRIEWADADALLAAERIVKLPAELVALRRAQELNEQAVTAVLEALRPGIREIDLTAVFHDALEDLGGAEVLVESVWCALPKARVEAPWATPGTLPYRELTSERVLREGDLVAMDTGILHEGYMSDFGRTWRCGEGPANGEERRLFEQWLEICERLMAACRPGNTALSLRRAALAGWRRPEPPWPVPLYVAHSLGLGGVEPPFVGTDLGEAVEDRWLLRPGMVLVLEPYVWEEGIGGYRAEETVVVTEGGCERFTRFSYGAFDT